MNLSFWNWLKNSSNTSESTALTVSRCFWQTDIHSHLLPGLDDGVDTIDQSILCIQELASWGITKLVTTPHVSQHFYPNTAETIRAGQDELQRQLSLRNIPVQLDVAAEYMLDDFFLDRLNDKPLLSFGAERYLLVETGFLTPSLFLKEILFRIQTKGYTPLLAHPERYPYYDNEALAALRDEGCLFQLNWMSLVGRYGSSARKQAKLLLKQKWVDFIGSDLHRPEDLPSLFKLFSSDTFDLLSQQPLRNSTL